MMFDKGIDLASIGVVEDPLVSNWSRGRVGIIEHSQNRVTIDTENQAEGFLVLTDAFYPTWRVTVDQNQTKIYRTDYNFRGIVVPAGKHRIEFYNSLF